jgi:PAS domain S-box-containing protein
VSDGIEAISGYPASDFIRNSVRSYHSIIHTEDLHWLDAAINHARFMHQPFELEYRILHVNGDLRWVYERGRFVYNANRQPIGLDGAIFDVTDRKRSEEELRIAEENYRVVFQKNLEESIKLEYLQKDLSAASSIQANILPHLSPLFPNHPRADVAATIIPAKDVGGDFFDAFALDANTICMVVADVSGKGIPAALFMVRAITSLRLSISLNETLDVSVQAINRHLCEGNDSFMFVTAFIALLDVGTGGLRYVNAGHNPPLVASEQGPYTLLPSPRRSLALGLDDQVSFAVSERTLQPGDRLVLYTDGVTEAENADGGFFSLESTVQLLEGLRPSETAEGIVAALKQAVFDFSREAPQSDDVTILALRYGVTI